MDSKDIPVTGARTAGSESQSTPDTSSDREALAKSGRGEVKKPKPETIAVDSAAEETEEAGEVEGRVLLAVKVTKKPRPPSKRDIAAKKAYAPRYSTSTRRPASKRPASFNPLAWVADGVTGAIEEVRHNDLGLSEDFWTHLYAVRRESLLTARALVESLITRVESKGDQQEERKQRRERRGSVNIDF